MNLKKWKIKWRKGGEEKSLSYISSSIDSKDNSEIVSHEN